MSNLYVGKNCIAASWKPLKIEPGGTNDSQGENQRETSTCCHKTAPNVEASASCVHTFFHFLGELIVLQQRAHVAASCAAHDGLHFSPVSVQPEVKVSEPEDLVEPRGDVSYGEECRHLSSLSSAYYKA